jgi:hypothetical protein
MSSNPVVELLGRLVHAVAHPSEAHREEMLVLLDAAELALGDADIDDPENPDDVPMVPVTAGTGTKGK